MGRLRDAWQTLRGKKEVQIRQHAQLVRIQAEWAGICTEIYNVIENLSRLDGRLKKREQRAVKSSPPEPTAVVPPPAKPWKAHKDELRARLRAGGVRSLPPKIESPHKANLEETG